MSDRKVALGATEYFIFNTSQFSTGAPFTLAGTPVISIYEDNGLTEITAGITLTVDLDSRTGMHGVAVVCSTANGFEAGKRYVGVITTGTVDSVSVVGKRVFEFRIETAEEEATRRLQGMFASHTVGATGNTTSAMHASFLPASLPNDAVNGEIWAWYDASLDDWLLIRVTDYVATGQVATVELLNKSALPVAPASGDYCFRISHNAVDLQRVGGTNVTWSATRGLAGTALPNAAADAAGGLPVSDLGGLDLDTQLAATNEITAARMGALTDLIDGGRLDLLIDAILLDTGTTIPATLASILTDTGTTLDGKLNQLIAAVITNAAGADIAADIIALDAVADAIKVITDQFTFTVANRVDANMRAINGTAVAGDGSATPWGP